MKFPKDFIWGAAASSYQIEGAAYHQGGGRSVWDMMARHEGKIVNNESGDIACDHINRFREDVSLMSDVGLQAYRFSVSWPRVLPEGVGRVNEKGLDFYSQLVDELLEHNITPWATLFHWDFPYDLYCRGGWLNRDSADWFADYTAIIVDKLSDRVSHWCTLNEPQVYIGLGHLGGIHAPGLQMGISEALLAGHHTLLAHGKAVQVIRARSEHESIISASHAGNYFMPDVEQRELDVEAARKMNFSIQSKDFFNNTWFSDPMVLGEYPQDGVELFGADMPHIEPGDMRTICQQLDYFGTNIYWGRYVRGHEDGTAEIIEREDLDETDLGWPVTPEVMYWAPKFYTERYHLPLVITENGLANADTEEDEFINDAARINFHRQYISEFGRGIQDGVPNIGYFLWSLMDNFEWAEGYSKRFGMVHIDYDTQQRTLKDSAYWYSHVIASGEVTDGNPRSLPNRAIA
ncbi:MAG: GH1 family beta-glucosidase [Pseudomonadota bacterium]